MQVLEFRISFVDYLRDIQDMGDITTTTIDLQASIFYMHFFFFGESFNLWCPLLMIALYHQTKTPISFWCRQGLNPRSLIKPLETLSVKLTRTHIFYMHLICLSNIHIVSLVVYTIVVCLYFLFLG